MPSLVGSEMCIRDRDMGMQKQGNETLYIRTGVYVVICAQSVSPPDSVSAEYALFGEYTE